MHLSNQRSVFQLRVKKLVTDLCLCLVAAGAVSDNLDPKTTQNEQNGQLETLWD